MNDTTRFREDLNWTQRQRLRALSYVEELVRTWGGWQQVLFNRIDFEAYVARTLGCRPAKAKEYIDILRGAQIFVKKMEDQQKDEGDPTA